MTAPNKMAKRAAAGTLALAICFTGGVLGAGAAQADGTFKFDQRYGGADRFETAVNATKAAFADGAGDVIIVQDDALADGLTASYLAGLKKAPILYVKQNEVPAATAAELDRLKAERIFIVGGTAVVSQGVASSLGSNGRTVSRVSGADRYETAARVATSGSNDVGTVFIANGDAPADALAGGPIAYKSNNPILLTRSMTVPASTKVALDQLQETNRIVLGGNAVVSTSTYTELDANNRLAGVNRQGTAVAIADYAVANEGFNRANAALVGPEDRNTADALIAAPLAGQTGTPILFTARDGISEETTKYLNDNAAALTGTGYIFGGRAAVSDADAAAATAAAGGNGTTPPTTPPTNPGQTGSLAVAPADAVTQVLAQEGSQTERDDNRLYQATGLKDGIQYRITLVDSDSIRATNDGVTFRSSTDTSSASGYSVDPGTRHASIVAVNGGAIAADPAPAPGAPAAPATTTAVPVNGTITFEIDGDNVGSVTPVIYLNGGPGKAAADGGPSIRLETSAAAAGEFAAATEPFGLGGKVTYVGQLGAEGTFNGTVASVNKDTNTFSTDATAATPGTPAAGANPAVPGQPAAPSARYTYDDNDTFQLGGQTVDLATFESQLSSGDGITGTFVQNASGNSTFNLADTNPAMIQNVRVTRSSGTDAAVTVTGTFPGNLREIDSFVVQRAVVANSTGDATMQQTGDYTTVATVPAADVNATTAGVQLRYVDKNVPTGQYAYRLAAINDGDQGPFTASTTTAGVSQTAATVVDTRLTDGGNTNAPFVLGTGDSFTIVGSDVLRLDAANAQLRISDNDGTVGDFVAGTNATFALNTTEQTVGGTVYEAGRVVTVTLTGDATIVSNQQNGVNTLGYPANLTDSAGITDEQGTKIALTGDVTITNDAPAANPGGGGGGNPPVTPPVGAAPTITGAQADSPTQVTVTLDQAVQSFGGGALDPAQFAYVNGANAAVPATNAVAGAGNTVVLTFPAATVDQAANAADNITYTDDNAAASDAGDVVSAADNTQQLADGTAPVTDVAGAQPPAAGVAPTVAAAAASAIDEITLTLDQPVQAFGADPAAFDLAQFNYNDGTAGAVDANPTAIAVDPNNPNALVLTFAQGTGPAAAGQATGTIAYADDQVGTPDTGDVVDTVNGNELADSTTNLT